MTLKAACLASVLLAATATFVVAAEAGGSDEPPYDLGYAFAASQSCPNTEFLAKPSEEVQATTDFKKGMAMFEHYVKKQSPEGACKAALTLYNATNGKVAKLLKVK